MKKETKKLLMMEPIKREIALTWEQKNEMLNRLNERFELRYEDDPDYCAAFNDAHEDIKNEYGELLYLDFCAWLDDEAINVIEE